MVAIMQSPLQEKYGRVISPAKGKTWADVKAVDEREGDLTVRYTDGEVEEYKAEYTVCVHVPVTSYFTQSVNVQLPDDKVWSDVQEVLVDEGTLTIAFKDGTSEDFWMQSLEPWEVRDNMEEGEPTIHVEREEDGEEVFSSR